TASIISVESTNAAAALVSASVPTDPVLNPSQTDPTVNPTTTCTTSSATALPIRFPGSYRGINVTTTIEPQYPTASSGFHTRNHIFPTGGYRFK
ncbi:hypothetical protein GX48_07793, partial [Paracoccidioides brasiliensis]